MTMEKWMLTERVGDGSQEGASDILTIEIITAVERAAPTRWQPLTTVAEDFESDWGDW